MAMAQGDPDELRDFANKLQSYLDILEEETAALNSGFQQLGGNWLDVKRQEYEDTHDGLLASISVFRENAQEQVPYLRRLADDLDTYLGR